MEFAAFAERASAIEEETADQAIVDRVADLLRAADADLAIVARFVQGRVFPAWSSRTLDVGPSYCYEAIARAAGRNVAVADVERRLAEVGDIGAVAEDYEFGGQRGLSAFGAGGSDTLTVREVSEELEQVAATSGEGSQATKIDVLFGLFNRCTPLEARYLARLVLSEMRIGVGGGTVRDAIAAAFLDDADGDGSAVAVVERALQVSNDYGRVAAVASEAGRDGLAGMELQVGRPVRAMLAQAGTVTDALESWGTVAVETKYDGARVQLHHHGRSAGEEESAPAEGEARIEVFSRNMEDVTNALPEVVAFAREHVTGPAILDGEVVAIDDDGRPLAFQAVLRRFRRKHDVERAREDVAVQPQFFDCLHAPASGGGQRATLDAFVESADAETADPGGEDLLDAPLTARHERLSSLVDDPDAVSELTLCEDADTVADLEAAALQAGHEGVMLKNPESTYTPGRRGKNWLKRKPDVETLDCVVTGAEWGEGRRAGLFGTFLLSVRDSDDRGDGSYATIGKVATGITDETLADLTELLEPHVRTEDGRTVEFEPAVVFEVGYEEIQASPTYSSGYALRFPRFLGVREDKDSADADTIERVERLAGANGETS